MAVYEDTPVYEPFVVPPHVHAAERRPSLSRSTGVAPQYSVGYPGGAAEAGSSGGAVPSRPQSAGGSAAASLSAILDPKQVFSAARHGRHKDVEKSLQMGFPPDSLDSFGNTLFHISCQNGNKRIAKLAIKYGGDMDVQNSKGNTGIHFLFAYGYPDVAEYFISKGADETIKNEAGLAPRQGIK